MKIGEYFGQGDLEGREIGLEVEMEGDNLPMELNYWRVTGDGSLRGIEAEYTLKNPTKRHLVDARIDFLYDFLAQDPWHTNPSDRCGVHVHINCRPLTVEQTFNFITLYLMFEPLLVHWCGEDREGNLFCLRSSDAEWLLMNLINDKAIGRFNLSISAQEVRYASLNPAALLKFGSLEFRSLRTPERPQQIKQWVKMLLSLKDKAVATDNISELIIRCSALGEREFTREIFEDQAKLLVFPGFEDLVLDGARQAQVLAFTQLGKAKNKATNTKRGLRGLPGDIVEMRDGRIQMVQRDPVEVDWRRAVRIAPAPNGE